MSVGLHHVSGGCCHAKALQTDPCLVPGAPDCRNWQREGGPPPSPGAPGHGARITGTHAIRSVDLLAMLKQKVCTHQQPNSRARDAQKPTAMS